MFEQLNLFNGENARFYLIQTKLYYLQEQALLSLMVFATYNIFDALN